MEENHGTIPTDTPSTLTQGITVTNTFGIAVATLLGHSDVDMTKLLRLLAQRSDRLLPPLQKMLDSMLVMKSYVVTADYGMRAGELLAKANCSGGTVVRSLRSDRSGKAGRVKVEFISLGRWVSSYDEALQEIQRRGYRPADFWEMMEIAARIIDPWDELIVVALGSFVEGSPPFLQLSPRGFREVKYCSSVQIVSFATLAVVRL